MSLPGGLRRVVLALLALVHVAASPLAMLGEARLVVASAERGVRNHIEDHSRPDCAPVHPDQCVLCQFLAHGTPEQTPLLQPTVPSDSDVGYRADSRREPTGTVRALERTRAPPLAV
jgi:hypothetical protein